MEQRENKIASDIPGFEETFSLPSLMRAWREFSHGKKRKADVVEFSIRFIDNLLTLQRDLFSGAYRHGGYIHFRVSDPKPRDIHKASVRDRILHHAVYQALYPYFDRYFIHDSYSCRVNKGTHRALRRFSRFTAEAGKNNTRTVWVLKGDVTKCFASVNHDILFSLLKPHIKCQRLLAIVKSIIDSFSSGKVEVGIPLGNLTSQLFINVYLNELDQFVKRGLKARRYIRYADDFVIFSDDKGVLMEHLPKVADFLEERLAFQIHPKKILLKTVASGVDFLGWTHFTNHRVLRTTTKQRMWARLSRTSSEAVVASYLGLLSHGHAHKQRNLILEKNKLLFSYE